MNQIIKNKLRLIVALLAVFFIAPSMATAADYYASVTGGPCDPNDGTSTCPWTLDEAIAFIEVNPGAHTLHLAPGTYSILTEITQITDGWTISGPGAILYCDLAYFSGFAAFYINASNVVFDGLTFQNFPSAIIIYGDNNQINNCAISNCMYTGIELNGNYSQISYCVLSNCGVSYGGGALITGIGNWITNNQFINCGNGIGVTAQGGSLPPGDQPLPVAKQGKAIVPPAEATQIINNLVYGGTSGISFYGSSSANSAVNIFHNTIVGSGSGEGIYVGQDTMYSPYIVEADIEFNIVMGFLTGIYFDPYYGAYKKKKTLSEKSVKATAALPTGISLWADYNDMFANGTDYDGLAPENIGTNNIAADPLFVAAGSNDYHLTDASPCRDAIPLTVTDPVTVDLDNIPRPRGIGFDMGAYEFPVYVLTVAVSPAGGGSVTGTGILCPADCDEIYASGTSVQVTATPAAGYEFLRWEGDVVSTTNPLTVTMNQDYTITAVFALSPHQLTVAVSPAGGGSVSGIGIACPGDCTELHPSGTSVGLTATPAAGYEFVRWEGDVASTTNPLTVVMNQDYAITAVFTLSSTPPSPPPVAPVFFRLTVDRQPIEGGSVAGDGIACPIDCRESYGAGELVLVTATAAEGYEFARWEGDIESTNNPLAVTMRKDIAVTAVFNKLLRLDVTILPEGAGTVTAERINCPGDCTDLYSPNTEVRLTTAPNQGYRFLSWTGDASGTMNTASVIMDSDKTAIVNFRTNHAPEFDLYPDRRINRNVFIEFKVTATDADGDPLAYSTLELPRGAMFNDHQMFSWTPGDDQAGEHVITFIVSDGVATDTMEVIITVNATDNSAPFQPTFNSMRREPELTSSATSVDSPFQPMSKSLRLFPPGSVRLQFTPFNDPENDPYFMTFFRFRRADQPFWLGQSEFMDMNQQEVILQDLAEGLKYICQVGYMDNGSGMISWSEDYPFLVGLAETDSNLNANAGENLEDYLLVSFTHWPTDDQASAVFGDDMSGGYDPLYYRFGTYDPNYGGAGGYIPFNELIVEPGRSYWLLARDGINITVEGVPVSLDEDMEIPLWFNSSNNDGWNMIGAPNAADYQWADVQVKAYDSEGNVIFGPEPIGSLTDSNPYIDLRLLGWESGSYFQALWIQRNSGYWVKALVANVHLVFPATAQDVMPEGALGKTGIKAADSDDLPPMPIPDFRTQLPAEAEDDNVGCFIGTVRK